MQRQKTKIVRSRLGKLKARHVLNYERLVTLAAKINMPTGYTTDLTVHDRAKIAENDPETFFWMARQNGTEYAENEFWKDPNRLLWLQVTAQNHPEALLFKVTEERIEEIDRQILFWNPEEIEERLA